MTKPSSNFHGKVRPLTRKQRAFVQHLITRPKDSATKAIKATYNVTTDLSARQQAHDNLTNPNILLELSKHDRTAQMTVVEVMNTSKEFSKTGTVAGASYAGHAIQAANSLLDRLHGKATQRVESTSTVVTLSLDVGTLTGEQADHPK